MPTNLEMASVRAVGRDSRMLSRIRQEGEIRPCWQSLRQRRNPLLLLFFVLLNADSWRDATKDQRPLLFPSSRRRGLCDFGGSKHHHHRLDIAVAVLRSESADD